MASATTDCGLAAELLQIIRDSRYNPVISPLNNEDKMTRKDFNSSPLSKSYWLDTSQCYINRKKNPLSMYQLFSFWSGDEPEELKATILDLIKVNYAYYKRVSLLWLKCKGISFTNWLHDRINPHNAGDELMLFAMCREFDRHCIIHSKTKIWSTVQTDEPLDVDTLHKKCDVILCFMGNGVFGVLRKKPGSHNAPLDTKSNQNVARLQSIRSIKGYETSMVNQLCEMDNRNKELNYLTDSDENKMETTERLGKKDQQQYCKPEPNDGRCNVLLASLNMDPVPEYVYNISQLPSFDEDELVEPDSRNNFNYPIPTKAITGRNIEADAESNANIYTVQVDNDDRDTESTDAVTDPLSDELYFPDVNFNEETPHQQSIEADYTVNAEIEVHEPDSLQDIVKSYMLNANYPHQVSLDEINRICKLPIMLLCVIPPKQVSPHKKTAETSSIKKCSVVVERLLQADLVKPGKTTEESKTESVSTNYDADLPSDTASALEDDSDNDMLPDLVQSSEQRYPKRNISMVNYQDNEENEMLQEDIVVKRNKRSSLVELKHLSSKRLAAHNSIPRTDPIVKPKSSIVMKPRPLDNTDPDPAASSPSHSSSNVKSNNTPNTSTAVPKRKKDNTRFHGIEVYKKKRKFNCRQCNFQNDTLAKLNAHHIKDHSPVHCTSCTKTFATPSTLARHMYSHGERKFKCKHSKCYNSFAFASELERHMLVHRTTATFKCHVAGCDRLYFSNAELTKHARVHDGKRWKCGEADCPYSTPDKRLLHQHRRKHSDAKPYECGLCGEGFKYHTEYTRHVRKARCEDKN